MFDLDSASVNTNVNEKFILNKTILNILSNSIPHETLTVGDKDSHLFTKILKISSKRKIMYIKAIKIVIQ